MVGSAGNLETAREQEEARRTPGLSARMLEPGTMWKKLLWGQEGVTKGCFRPLSPPCPHLFPFSPSLPLLQPRYSFNTPRWIPSRSPYSGCSLSLERPGCTHSWLPCVLEFSAQMAPPHQGQTLATPLNTEPHPPTLPAFFFSSVNFSPPDTHFHLFTLLNMHHLPLE